MNRKSINACRNLCADIAEEAITTRLFLPSRAGSEPDWPLLNDHVKHLHGLLWQLSFLLEAQIPAPVRGEDILWKLTKYELPEEHRTVLVSIANTPHAHEAFLLDARWYFTGGIEICGEVYAWSPRPPSCLAQHARLLLQAPAERRVS